MVFTEYNKTRTNIELEFGPFLSITGEQCVSIVNIYMSYSDSGIMRCLFEYFWKNKQCYGEALLYYEIPWHLTAHNLQNIASSNTEHGGVKQKQSMYMMMSWHRYTCCMTGPLWGESTGHRWITLTKGQSCNALMFSLLLVWTNC